MEPTEKKPKLHGQLKELHVPCIMVMEMLQDVAQKQGLKFECGPQKPKRTLTQAQTEWFYNKVPNSTINGKRQTQNKPEMCKKMLVKAHQIKATKMKKSCSFFEVEYIADFKVTNGKRHYLVKWVGWPKEANTWECVSNLNCPKLIQEFHCDYVKQLNNFLTSRKLTWSQLQKQRRKKRLLQHLYDMVPNNFRFQAQYALRKQEAQAKLLAWQTRMNAITRGAPLIAIENEVDLEPLPDSFIYLEQNIAGIGVNIPTDPLIGCDCVGSCSLPLEQGECCPGTHKGKPAYQNGLVKLKPGKPIFECNSRCQCGLSCPNRIVQKGPQIAMSLFRTSNGKGWGVKALEPVMKGTFVMEYVGEVITNDEAEIRGKIYDNAGITYLFDLDFYDEENPLTVDATNYGNISHFVNHSCSPNLQVYNVFVDNIDPAFPRIALFARRNIAINEEFTFDYQMTGDMTDGQEDVVTNITEASSGILMAEDDTASDVSRSSSCSSIMKRTKCLCGSSNCRGWLI
uniref:Histone-lysine N-methyltransferase n=1 Tax=Phallusia mammillata TaxID=59560 RepID=A0A6F9DUK8_9ASCI|nr:histone-lysine N-methyltransferase SUV39H2 [Phallusia mammillata]